MKTLFSLLGLALLASFADLAAEEPRMSIRDVATDHELLMIYQQAVHRDPLKELGDIVPEPMVDGSSMPQPRDIVASSDILCNLKRATLVPKRALLHMPERFSDRLGMKDGAQLLSFQEFLKWNKTWLSTYEVTQAQAEGREVIDPERLGKFVESGRAVVATMNGGPISILPLQVEEIQTAEEGN